MGEEDLAEYNLSEDEGVIPDKPVVTGLFCHKLFKTLLFKAKTMANMGAISGHSEGSMDSQDPSTLLFTEPVTEQEVIASPKLFIDVIQRQWNQPGTVPAPSGMDRRMYTVEQNLEELLKLPTVDAPMANLATTNNLSSDSAEGLKTEDRTVELSVCMTHQAAWVIQLSILQTRPSMRQSLPHGP